MPVCPNCGHANREVARFCEQCGAALTSGPAQAQPQRRIVTVVFCDLTGSTELGDAVDPEPYRELLARYFERMAAVVERHGGVVEKFIGDAVMAVFGVPVAHEDDALRAARAAVEMREVLPTLGLTGRIGVMTGEVVTGTEERLATGDAVNVAARLEQAAPPGEILIGRPTLRLVEDAVEVEPVEPLHLKGKPEPVPAFRLRAVREAPERRHDMPFVGRREEVRLVGDAWERARAERRCVLVTVVGEAGVGKSRLVAEALEPLEAWIVRGRCLPYGDGITYWPVVEVLKQLGVSPPEDAAAVAVRVLLGEVDSTSSPDEIAWAFRKTLEHAAAERPLVVVFDDIQWGEETFRDLIEHVALLSTGAPILLLCMARPELVERRPTWPVTIRLEPLADELVDALIPSRMQPELRERIAATAGGNPLFIREMLAMTNGGGIEVVVPPTLKALLAARLDQLEPGERSVLEHASVEGEIFHRGAVQALAETGTDATPRLAALVRKELIRPERAQLAGEDGFRFRHGLIRDAAYDTLPKTARAERHAQLAAWFEHHAAALVEIDELVGYHLDQAVRYRTELGLPDDDGITRAARRRLTNAGLRAARRQDFPAASRLLERAASLVPAAEIDLAVESALADVLVWTGRTEEAMRRADALAARAAAGGNRVGELCARIQAARIRLDVHPDEDTTDLAGLVAEALPLFEQADDQLALYLGQAAIASVAMAEGRFDDGVHAFDQASLHADRAGHDPAELLGDRAWVRFMGTTPASELLAWLDEHEARAGSDQFFRAYRGWSLGRVGRFDEARRIIADARAEQADRGGGLLLANLVAFESASIELLAGDPAAAAEFAAEGCRLHEELGELQYLAGSAAVLAEALYELDRLDEADAWSARSAELAPGMWFETPWRGVRAKVLARRGAHEEAQLLARSAVELLEVTHEIDRLGFAYADLAEVLRLGGRDDEAAAALRRSLEQFERKDALVMADRVRARLTELEGTS